ncbi:hypothetical protein [Halobacteriovorax sp. JY17]|uniref:hypothetical protein n=1 Tax=Halobacteriovorax sp. JY17 TaxID=2014617 RepID=UPI000C679256|nr:hypothetical protein [Halobacteriovorax sp. JY17]PIK15284.1 MAG: hypothetical protein CES88_00815 [Halobacteriovorax sp. JY17]
MKVKNLILLIFLSVLSAQSALAHRLVYETQDSSNNIATGVYLNEVTGDLVIQKYQFSKSELKARDYEFPKEVKSFASFYHPLSKLRPDIAQEKINISLHQSSPDIQVELEKAMRIPRAAGNELIQKVNLAIFEGGSNKVIPGGGGGGSGSQKSFAILSDKSGKLLLAKGRNSKLSLPKVSSFPKDLVNSLSSKSSKELDISTPMKVDRALSSMNSIVRTYDFSQNQRNELINELNKKKNALSTKISNMSLVKSVIKNGERVDLYFDFNDGSFYLKTSKNGVLKDDEFFPVSDDKNLEDLKHKLEREGLYSKNEFDESFDDYYIQSCESLESLQSLLPDLDSNIANILKVNDKLWGSYLENAISSKPIILQDGGMVFAISALNESHNVKLKVNNSGEVIGVDFLDEEKATRDGLKVKRVTENGKAYFKIVATDPINKEEIDQFFFDSEKSADGRNSVAVYVRGSGEGKDIYDKNIYKISLSEGRITQADKKIQLSSSRDDAYPQNISRGSGQEVKSFFFKNFFSLDSKREKLADEIQSAVNGQIGSINKDGKVYLNKGEINQVVLDIVNDVERDIPELNADVGKLTAKTYEHSYKNFVSNIVPKMVKELLPGESDKFYSDITNASMLSLNRCLEKASEKSNEKAAADCMEVYMKEAPIKIGEEVLKFQLKVNDQEALSATSVSEYTKCIKENYDATLDMAYVKGCVFKALLTSVDKGLERVVSVSLEDMENVYKKNGKNITLNVSSETLDRARKDLRECYEKKGYIAPRLFKDNYNQRKLNSLGTDEFKNDLLSCSSRIEQVVGRSVSQILVNHELDAMDIKGSEKDQIRNTTLVSGYDNCIEIQKGMAERLAAKGEFSTVRAGLCADLVTLTATNLVITKTLKDKLGNDLWADLMIRDKAPHIKCFEDLKSAARNELIESEGRTNGFEKESAECLKESVVWASYHLGQSELANVFASDPLYRNVSLSDQKKDYYAKMIQSCFKKKLASYDSVTEVSSSLDKIQSACTVELVMSDSASSDILAPIVTGMLEDSGVDKEIIDKTRGDIVDKMRQNVSKALEKKDLNLDEVVIEFKKIQGEATYLVADSTIDKYVHDMVPGENSEKISKELREKLFEGKYNFRPRLLEAKSKEDLDFIVNHMTEIAAVDLTEHASRAEGKKLQEKGLLKTNEDVEKLAKNGRNYMEKCLEERAPSVELKTHLDSCVLKVKSSVTYDVFDDQLKELLFTGPYSEAFTDSEREVVYKKFINEDLREGINQSYKDDNLEALQSKFTLEATSVIGEKVLRKSINDLYIGNINKSSPDYLAKSTEANAVADIANDELQNCLESLKGKPDANTEECINAARFKATSLVFADKVRPFLNLLSKNKSVQDRFLNTELSVFKRCTEVKGNLAKEYTDAVNGCLVESIFDLVSELVVKGSETTDFLKNIAESDLSDFRVCIEDKKRDLVKNSADLKSSEASRKSLYAKIDKREDFWMEYFNNSPSEDSQKKIDWAIEVVQVCGLSRAVPEVLSSLRQSGKLSEKLSLSRGEELYTINAIAKVEQFAKDTLQNGLWLKMESKETESNSTVSEELELETLSTYLDQYMPMIGEYLKKLHDYDEKGSKAALDKLLNQIRAELKVKGELSLDDLKSILMKSDLIDIVIEAEIANFVKKEAKEPLSKEGVDAATIEKLGSKNILGPIFKTSEGKKAIAEIKEQFIAPMLAGKGSKDIPESIVTDVKHLLAKDTRVGGFVETLAGAIVQKKLEEKRPKNFASSGIASMLGYDTKDFLWSNLRTRRESGTDTAQQPVNKALGYFGDKILLPMLLKNDLGTRTEKGIFRDSKIDIMQERQEKFSTMIEDIMEL